MQVRKRSTVNGSGKKTGRQAAGSRKSLKPVRRQTWGVKQKTQATGIRRQASGRAGTVNCRSSIERIISRNKTKLLRSLWTTYKKRSRHF